MPLNEFFRGKKNEKFSINLNIFYNAKTVLFKNLATGMDGSDIFKTESIE